MARTKEFDRDVALERALDVFWEKGYEATSVADLVTATGVQRQSLYDTFGDKHGLYRAALDLYAARSAALLQAVKGDGAGGSPLTRLRRVFRWVASDATPGNRGCMLVNSAVERGLCDEVVIEHARTGVGGFERALATVILEAQEAGEVPRSTPPKAAARMLVALFWGLRAMGRAVPDPAWQRSVVDSALGLLTNG
jgi:TetR/AcrR family transcriptional repressor of nem operon